jgi:hypothetical protein
MVNSLTWYQPKQSYTASAPSSLHHSRRRPLSTPASHRRLTPPSPLPYLYPPWLLFLCRRPSSSTTPRPTPRLHAALRLAPSSTRLFLTPATVPPPMAHLRTTLLLAPPRRFPTPAMPPPTRVFSTPATPPATRLLPTPATSPPTRLFLTPATPPSMLRRQHRRKHGLWKGICPHVWFW